MKTFLLITAVVSAGLIPQVALCNANSLVDSMKAVGFYNARMAGVDPSTIPALKSEHQVGPTGRSGMKALPCQEDKTALKSDKHLPGGNRDSAGQAEPAS